METQLLAVVEVVPARQGAVVPTMPPRGLADQADSDGHLIGLWLDGRSEHTVRAYGGDVRAFLAHARKSFRDVTVGDVHAYGASLAHLSGASRARRLSAVKSVLAYGHRLGYLPFDVGAAVRLPAVKGTLAERIVDEGPVLLMLAMEKDARNAVLLGMLYRCGLRISEPIALRWRDLTARKEGGQATVFGKGGKTRVVLIPPKLWRSLLALRGEAGSDAPVFATARGEPLSPSRVHQIVKAAAARADMSPELSAHWLRHAHASHSIERGCPLPVLQATLGHSNVATTSRYLHARPSDGSSRYLPE